MTLVLHAARLLAKAYAFGCAVLFAAPFIMMIPRVVSLVAHPEGHGGWDLLTVMRHDGTRALTQFPSSAAWVGAFFLYSIAVSAPVVLVLFATGLAERRPTLSRFILLAAFEAFSLWIGPLPMVLVMAVAGWVLAAGLFPRRSLPAAPSAPELALR